MSYKEKQLIFGSGGGFTGGTVETIILDNGQVFRHNSLNEEIIELKKLKKKLTKEIFEKYYSLALNDMELNQPGDLYRYIKLKDENGVHTLMWGGDGRAKENADLVSYFQYLKETIKNINP
ncbi:MAG: hypothetical protein AAGK97_03400 [Bacteroidota bacterium]